MIPDFCVVYSHFIEEDCLPGWAALGQSLKLLYGTNITVYVD